MSEYLLDANHASPLVTVGHPLRRRVLQELRRGHEFFIAVPALAEVLFGFSTLPRAISNRAEWVRLSRFVPCFELDEENAKLAASLQVTLRRVGRDLKLSDALIATVALSYDLILLTSDKDFSPVPGLKIENWL